jgi:hypothetical protein
MSDQGFIGVILLLLLLVFGCLWHVADKLVEFERRIERLEAKGDE